MCPQERAANLLAAPYPLAIFGFRESRRHLRQSAACESGNGTHSSQGLRQLCAALAQTPLARPALAIPASSQVDRLPDASFRQQLAKPNTLCLGLSENATRHC